MTSHFSFETIFHNMTDGQLIDSFTQNPNSFDSICLLLTIEGMITSTLKSNVN